MTPEKKLEVKEALNEIIRNRLEIEAALRNINRLVREVEELVDPSPTNTF